MKSYIWGLGLLVLLIASVLYYQQSKTKIRYVNFIELYDSFNMKKELEEGFKKAQSVQVAKMDSLKAELSVLSQNLQGAHERSDEEVFEKKRQLYFYQQKSIEQEQEEQMLQYKDQIIKRLKLYVSDYSKEEGIDVLLGQDEGFSTLYAKESLNVTQDLLKYVNEKYKGTR